MAKQRGRLPDSNGQAFVEEYTDGLVPTTVRTGTLYSSALCAVAILRFDPHLLHSCYTCCYYILYNTQSWQNASQH